MNKANNIKIKASKMKGDKSVSIELGDELTIYTIESISEIIIENTKKYDQIDITANEIKNIDLSFIQLIDAIQKMVVKNGKKMSLKLRVTLIFLKYLEIDKRNLINLHYGFQ